MIKKAENRIVALLLTVAMLCSMATPVLAEDTLPAPQAEGVQEVATSETAATPEDAAQLSDEEIAALTAGELQTLAAVQDWTNDKDQLLLYVGKLTYSGADNTPVTVPSTLKDGKIDYDFSSVPLSGIQKMNLELAFEVVKDDADRKIKEGDTFTCDVPGVFKVQDNLTPTAIYAPNGNCLGTFTVKNNKIVFVFDKSVDIESGNVNIFGDIEFTFTLDADEMKDPAKSEPSWQPQTNGTTYQFHLPKNPTELNGITKVGAFDSANTADSNIIWTITVGTDEASKGLPLKGVTVTDTFDASQQEFLGAYLGEVTEANKLAGSEAAGSFSYTFPEDSTATAPATIKVVTRPDKALLTAAGKGENKTVSNTATMEPGKDSDITAGDDTTATGETTIPSPSIAKKGTPLNADTIHYEITVGKGAIKNAVVTDALKTDENGNKATLPDGTKVYVDGKGYDLNGAAGTDGTYVTYIDNVLKVYLKGTDGIITDGALISFDAHIETVSGSMDTNLNFPNDATLTGEYPWAGIGPGPGVDWHLPEVVTDFQVAYIEKTTPAVDTKTGIIDWKIAPSTRTTNFTSWTITDMIGVYLDKDGNPTMAGTCTHGDITEVDQKYIEGSLQVWDGTADVTAQCDIEVTDVTIGGVATQQITVTPNATGKAALNEHINSITVTLKTQGVNFLYDNSVDHTYQNATKLDVEKVIGEQNTHFIAYDDANRAFENEFLAKTSDYSVVDSAAGSVGYLHYQICVNKNQMSVTGLTVTDDLTTVVPTVTGTLLSGKTEPGISAADWTVGTGEKGIKVTKIAGETETDVTAGYAVADWASAKNITAAFGDTDAAYKIDVYLTLNVDKLLELQEAYGGNYTLSLSNSATATTPEFNAGNGTTVTCDGKQPGSEVNNQAVSKSAVQKDGLLNYTIKINPNGASMVSAILTDSPDDSVDIDLDSVQLYYANHTTGGAISDTQGAAVADGWSKEFVYDSASGKIVLKVTLPTPSASSYLLCYKARVIKAVPGGKVGNDVSLTVNEQDWGNFHCDATIDSSSWGWMTTAAIYKVVKADEFAGKSLPLSGIVFMLYDGTNKLVKTAVSNAQGIVAFYGLDPSATYHLHENAAPSGYKILGNDVTFTTGAAGSNIVQELPVKNERETTNLSVGITKTYPVDAGDSAITTTPQSQFKLYLYPKGYAEGNRVEVYLNGSDGVYSYAAAAVTKPEGTADTLTNTTSAASKESGTISINGLPWGCYALEETTAVANGYTQQQSKKYFEVAYNAGNWTVDYNPAGTPAANVSTDASFANDKTHLTIKKTADAGYDLSGAVLSIYTTENGSKTETMAKNALTGQTMTTTISGTGITEYGWDVSGLAVGTYYLVEDTAPTDSQLAKFKDVKFTINVNGSITKNSGTATVNGINLTVKDELSSITVKKQDQFSKDVIGATITLQKKTGGTWENVDSWTSSASSSSHKFTNLLRDTTYKLVETTTPTGYLKANEIEFTIDAKGDITNVNYNNGNASANWNGWNYTNTLSSWNRTFTMRDERIMGQASFTKRDTTVAKSNKTLAGVSFDLYKVGAEADTKINETALVSGTDGLVTTVTAAGSNTETGMALKNGLTPGSYYFVETATHSDFVLPTGDDAKTDTFVVEADGSNRYTCAAVGENPAGYTLPVTGAATENKALHAKVTLVKVDADMPNSAVPGAVYTLTGTDAYGNTVSIAATTGNNGDNVTANPVTDSNGNAIDDFTRTADGQAVFMNVPRSNAAGYTVKETAPAPGYILNKEQKWTGIKVDSTTTTIALAEKATDKQTSFTLTKTDATSGSKLPGAQFSIVPVSGSKFSDGTTAAQVLLNGTTTASTTRYALLVVGNSYIITETKTPTGYTAARPVTITMGADGVVNTTVANARIPGSLTITKVDGTDEALLTGAVYGLYQGETLAYTLPATDATGAASISNLTWGSYTLKEITPPTGYTLSTESYDVTIDANHTVIALTGKATDNTATTVNVTALRDVRKTGKVVLTKVSAENNAVKLNGVTFLLEKQKEATNVWDSLVSALTGKKYTAVTTEAPGEDGMLVIEGLAWGNYRITETLPADGYTNNSTTEITFTINGKENEANLVYDAGTITNAPTQITVLKTGENETALTGATLKITGAKFAQPGITELTWTSDATTHEIKQQLVAGVEYTLTETTRHAGYEAFTGEVKFTLAQDGSITGFTTPDLSDGQPAAAVNGTKITLRNVKIYGVAQLTKTGASAETKLAGVTFAVYSAADDTEVQTGLVTDANGIITTKSLPEGSYYFKETATLDSYVLDETTKVPFTVAGTNNGQTLSVSMANAELHYACTLQKWDADHNTALAGAGFTLYKKVGEAWAAVGTEALSAEDGTVAFDVTEKGTYKVKETSAPADYAVPTFESAEFTVDNTPEYAGKTLDLGKIENRCKTGTATIVKVDALDSDTKLAGVAFTLTNTVTGAAETKTTDANGKLEFTGLLYGDAYTLAETTTLDNYLLSSVTEKFTLSDAYPAFAATGDAAWQNAPTEFRFTKVQTTGEVLPGATFALFDGDKKLDTQISDASGIVWFHHFAKGKSYTIKETAAPEGYFVNPTVFTLVVDADGSTTMQNGDETVTEVVNSDMGSITLVKKDATDGLLLAGAVFTLTNGDGKVVDTQTTDENGQLVFAALPMGSYTVAETQAPSGYVLAENSVEVTLVKGSTTQNITLQRTNSKAQFGFAKTVKYLETCYSADSVTELPGVTFTLYSDKECANAVYTAQSDAKGRVRFENIEVGTWYMKETAVPAGSSARLDSTLHTVEIDTFGSTKIDGAAAEGTTIINDVERAEIKLLKVNENNHGEVLANSTYGLYRVIDDAAAMERATAEVSASPLDLLLRLFKAGSKNEVLVAKATTDANGVLRFEGVLVGVEYTIRELVAPNGSEVSEKPITITFEVDATTGKAVITKFDDGSGTAKVDENGNITWFEPPTKAKFTKVDEAGRALAGATLRITHADGSLVDGVPDWVSDGSDGHLVEGILVGGESYLLQELKAPDGYQLADPIAFTMSTDPVAPSANYIQSWQMVDKKIPVSENDTDGKTTNSIAANRIPQTGDALNASLLVILMLTSALGMGTVIYKKKKR